MRWVYLSPMFSEIHRIFLQILYKYFVYNEVYFEIHIITHLKPIQIRLSLNDLYKMKIYILTRNGLKMYSKTSSTTLKEIRRILYKISLTGAPKTNSLLETRTLFRCASYYYRFLSANDRVWFITERNVCTKLEDCLPTVVKFFEIEDIKEYPSFNPLKTCSKD